MHGFSAIRGDIKLFPCGNKRLPNMSTIMCWHINLVGELTGKANTEDPGLNSRHCAIAPIHKGECVTGQINITAYLGNNLSGIGPCNSSCGPVISHRCEVHLQLWPFGLLPKFQPCQYPCSTASSRKHQVVIVTQTGADAIVEDHSILF